MKSTGRMVVLALTAFAWSARAQTPAAVVKSLADETAETSRAVLGRARLDVRAKDVSFPILVWGEEPSLVVSSSRDYFSVAALKACGGGTVILTGTNRYFLPGSSTAMNRAASAAKTNAELELSSLGEPSGGGDESETVVVSLTLRDKPEAGKIRVTFADYQLEIAAKPGQEKCALEQLQNATFRRLTID